MNKYAKPRLTLKEQKTWEEEEKILLIELRKVEGRKAKVDKNNEEIKKKEGSHKFSDEQKEWVKM